MTAQVLTSVVNARQTRDGWRGHDGAVSMSDQFEKLRPRSRIVAKCPEHRARDGSRVLSFDAAHRHAEVRAFADHRDTDWIDLLQNRFGDLIGHALLKLQAPREDVYEPGNLAQADHAPVRNVGDVTLAEKRQEMMLAQAVEIDVLHDYHFTVVHSEQGIVQNLVNIGIVPARQELECLRNPHGRPD